MFEEWVERDKRFNNQKSFLSGPDAESFKRGYEFIKYFVRSSDVVVDAACRDNIGSKVLVNECKTMYCVDRDEFRLKKAMSEEFKEKNNIVYEHKDSLREELPECDVLVTSSLFHHYPKELLTSIFGKLCKNVKRDVMIFAPNGKYYPKIFFDERGHGDHVYHPFISDLEYSAISHGFIPLAVYHDHYPRYKNHFCIVFRRKSVIKKETGEKCLKEE
jgi:hypothetical protein